MILLSTIFAIIIAVGVYYHTTTVLRLREAHQEDISRALLSYQALLLQIKEQTISFQQKEKEHLAALDKKYYDDYVDLAQKVHQKLRQQEEAFHGDQELKDALRKASLYYKEQ